MNKTRIAISIVVILLIILGVWDYIAKDSKTDIASFEECQKAGYPVLESYPLQCKLPNGTIFKQGAEPNKDLLDPADKTTNFILETNLNKTIESPLSISGKATGPWFFEASFTSEVQDENGTVLGLGIMTAEEDWMTEELVPFQGEIKFSNPTTNFGLLVFKSANPSGLSTNQQKISFPIRFNVDKTNQTTCYVGGCGNQICSSQKDVITTCEYRPEYECLKHSQCEKQLNGGCGWTETTEYKKCLENLE